MDAKVAHEQFERRALRLENSTAIKAIAELGHISRVNENLDDSRYLNVKAFVRSLGSDRTYELVTYELSSREVFLVCENPQSYPFLEHKTLIDVVLKLGSGFLAPVSSFEYVSFIGKLEEVVYSRSDKGPSGFLVKIVQMSFEERCVYDKLILVSNSH